MVVQVPFCGAHAASTPPDPLLHAGIYSQLPPLCLPAGPTSACIVTACITIDGICYNVLLLEMSSVALQNHLCAYDIPVYI